MTLDDLAAFATGLFLGPAILCFAIAFRLRRRQIHGSDDGARSAGTTAIRESGHRPCSSTPDQFHDALVSAEPKPPESGADAPQAGYTGPGATQRPETPNDTPTRLSAAPDGAERG